MRIFRVNRSGRIWVNGLLLGGGLWACACSQQRSSFGEMSVQEELSRDPSSSAGASAAPAAEPIDTATDPVVSASPVATASPVLGIPAPAAPVVCFKTSTGSDLTPYNGVTADLTYLSPIPDDGGGSTTTASFAPSAPNVVSEPAKIFLSQFNLPTENFSDGFQDRSGARLQDGNGDTLIQWFSLRASAKENWLMLNAGDVEGDYELAVLADDGALVSINPNGVDPKGVVPWINDDGVHANRLGCAAKEATIHMTRFSPLALSVNWYQGPPVRIALMLLWRLKTGSSIVEPECDQNRDDSYFFTGEPPSPTSAFTNLAKRGWKVVPAANYYLANGQNPCVN